MTSLVPASTLPSHLARVRSLVRSRNVQANFLVRRCFSESGCSRKISENARQYAAAQGIAEEETLAKGREEKSKKFVEAAAEVYIPAWA